MKRLLRIEYPGAVYHITSRGNEKRDTLGTLVLTVHTILVVRPSLFIIENERMPRQARSRLDELGLSMRRLHGRLIGCEHIEHHANDFKIGEK
jgi:hypothetical protein